ncbi:MAG: hypothetical protein GX053_07580 [Tissierella sp.]|nr:hypothetical protein [Tissierella sp.]
MVEELTINPDDDVTVETENIDDMGYNRVEECCGNESLLFFFLILAIFMQNGILCTDKDSLLFFFLLLTIIMNG